MSILSILIWLPVLGAALCLIWPGNAPRGVRGFALAVAGVECVLSLVALAGFDSAANGYQYTEFREWIAEVGIAYRLGVDGIALLLVVLTTFLTFVSLLASWREITEREKGFNAVMLLLEAGVIGVFCATDLFLFYIFWEAMLIPMYFIIGIWGSERRVYAALKFFIYTMSASLLMLVAILVVYISHGRATGIYTFEMAALVSGGASFGARTLLAAAFFGAFAVKVPLFPLHTWLPDAHVEAPTAGSVLLAGALLKMGAYGILRYLMPLFVGSLSALAPLAIALAVIGIIYGALVAFAQTDLKKLIAYSSVSHLGFVVLGLFACNEEAVSGAALQMINHGLSTGALFLIVGMIYQRAHTKQISELGGIWADAPILSSFFLFFTFASIGLPGLNNFVGEFLVLVGTFQENTLAAVLAATGVVLAAIYMLSMFRRVVFRDRAPGQSYSFTDLSRREIVVLTLVALPTLALGVYPQPALRTVERSVTQFVQQMRGDVVVMSEVPARMDRETGP